MTKKIYRTAILIILSISLVIFAGCGANPFAGVEAGDESMASIQISLTFPDFMAMREKDLASKGAASKIIDPGTQAVALLLADGAGGYVLHQELTIADGTTVDYPSDYSSNSVNISWSGAFTGILAGDYAAGDLRFELRDAAGGTALVAGANESAVTLIPGITVDTLIIHCLPESHSELNNANAYTAAAQNVAADSLVYYSFQALTGKSYTADITKTGGTGYPDMYVLNSLGVIIDNVTNNGGTSTLTSPVYDNDELVYIAVYGSSGAAEFTITAYEAGASSSNEAIGGALDIDDLVWTLGGDADFTVVTDVTHDGVDALKSGLIIDSQSSTLETTVTIPAEGGAVSFFWKVSSESTYDKAEFSVDGNVIDTESGLMPDWTEVTHELAAGTYTLTWGYSKDGSLSSNDDCLWLDEVSIITASPTLAPVVKTIVDNGTEIGENVIGESDGNLLIAYYDATGDHLAGVHSADGGETWTEPFIIDDSSSNLGGYIDIDSDATGFYLSYMDYTTNDLKFVKVNSSGTPGAPATIAYAGSSIYSSITVSGSNVYILYEDDSPGSSAEAYTLAHSSNGGDSWGTPEILIQEGAEFNGTAISYLGSSVAIAVTDNALFAAVSVSFRFRLITSIDDGTTWSFVPGIDLGDIQYPSITVVGSTILITVSDQYSDTIEALISTDSGSNWTQVSAASTDVSLQYRSSVIDGSTMYVPFKSNSSGYALKLAKSTDNGVNWSETTIDPVEMGYHATTALYDGNICIAYRVYDGSSLKFARSSDGVTWQ
jgi:hypothetical protein